MATSTVGSRGSAREGSESSCCRGGVFPGQRRFFTLGLPVDFLGSVSALGAAPLSERNVGVEANGLLGAGGAPVGHWTWVAVVVVATALVAVWGGIAVVKSWRLRHSLKSRVRFQMLPTDSFDPHPEDVVRFGFQLARVRSVTGRFGSRGARAVRVRLGTEAGRLGVWVEGPERSASVLRHQGYGQVELRRVDEARAVPGRATWRDLLQPWTGENSPPSAGEENSPPHVDMTKGSEASSTQRVYVARAELTLAMPDRYALRAVPLRPDPLQSVAAAVADVRDDLGEQVDICLDLDGVTPARVAHLARRRALGRRHVRDQVLDQVFGAGRRPQRQRSKPASAPAEPDKLSGTTEPVFTMQLLIRVSSQIPGRPEAHLHQILAAFDQWTGENRFRTLGRRYGAWYTGSDAWWRRARFDRRVADGWFAPRKPCLITVSEISGLLKPPTRHCAIPNVMRSGGMVPPPPSGLPSWSMRDRHLMPLGWVSSPDGTERFVGMPVKDMLFLLQLGKAGFGKTEAALVRAISLAHGGTGVWFLDPHGDAWQRARPYLAHPHLADRIWELDLTVRELTATQAGWNPLSMRGRRMEDIQEVVAAVTTGIGAAMSWGDTANRAQTILTKACETLCYLALRLPAHLNPTIFQVRTLLLDDEWREQIIPLLPRDVGQFWLKTFPRYAAEALPVVTNIIERLSASISIKALLGQPQSTYDVRAAMDDGRIVFVCPAGTGATDRIVSCLLIYDLFRAGMSRRDIPPEQRRPIHAFVDEVTAIDGAAKGSLAAIVEQLRKFGVRGHFMTQMPQRLTPTTRDALLQNQSVLATTAGEAKAAQVVTTQWGKLVEPGTVVKLEKYHHVISITLDGHPTDPFKLRGAHVEETFADVYNPDDVLELQETIDATMSRRRIGDILDDIETLDDRILTALVQPSRPPDPRDRYPARSSGTGIDLVPVQEGLVRVIPLRPDTTVD